MKHEPSPDGGPDTANGNTPGAAPSGFAREYHNLLSDLEDLVASTRASVGNLGGELAERARSGASAADDYVRSQPWQAIAISAGVGVLIGVVLGRGQRGS